MTGDPEAEYIPYPPPDHGRCNRRWCNGPVVSVPAKRPQCYVCAKPYPEREEWDAKPATADNHPNPSARALLDANPEDYP